MGQVDSCPKYGSQRYLLGPAKLFWGSGLALIATAAFLFSCTSLAVKLLGSEVPTFQVVLVPGLICFIVTSGVVKLNGTSVRSKSWRIVGLTVLRGLLGATSITCFYIAIELLPLQDAVTLFFCSPVVAILLELAVTGESQGWACAAATACTVAGVVLVAQPPCIFSHHHGMGAGSRGYDSGQRGEYRQAVSLASHTSAAGVALATLAAISNAAAFVVVRVIKQSQSTLVLTWWYHGVVTAVSAIPLALGYPDAAVLPTRRGCVLLLVVGVTQFLGQLLLNRGFQLESATRGSAINVLQVLFSFVWDVTVLGDKPGLVSIAGSSLVAAGVLFMALTGSSPRPSEWRHPPRHYRHPSLNTDTDEQRFAGIHDRTAEQDLEQPLVGPEDSSGEAAAEALSAVESRSQPLYLGPAGVVTDGEAEELLGGRHNLGHDGNGAMDHSSGGSSYSGAVAGEEISATNPGLGAGGGGGVDACDRRS